MPPNKSSGRNLYDYGFWTFCVLCISMFGLGLFWAGALAFGCQWLCLFLSRKVDDK